ncbi:MAG: beta-1,4-xylanase [Terriglobia bacterium]
MACFISLLAISPRMAEAQIPLDPAIPGNLGVDIHFTSPQPGEMRELAATGVRWIRMDLDWSATERVKGEYDFSAYDKLLAALAPYHIRPLLILCYANKFYDHGLPPHTEAGRAAFARWAAAAALHFHGRGVVWEMYNEPNYIRFWKPKPHVEDYILLALATGEAIQEADPGATIVGPASALIDLRFLAACFQAGLLNYWSGVSVHPYRQRDPETVLPELRALRALIAHYTPPGKKIPVITSEWGYSSTWKYDHMNEQTQARMLAREWLFETANGVPLTIWYDWRDDGQDPVDPEAHFGLVRFAYRTGEQPVFTPKPDYRAAATLTHTLAGYRFSRRLAVGDPGDYVLLFTRGGSACLVAWTTSTMPHSVVIPHVRGRFRATGFEGARLHGVRANRHGLHLKLSADPVYVTPTGKGVKLSWFSKEIR